MRVGERGIAGSRHAIGDTLDLGGEDVVHGVMGVLADGDVVGAVLDDVGARTMRVEAREQGGIDGDLERLALAGLEELGLVVGYEGDGSFLDAVLTVIFGVGSLGVDLHGVLARDVSGVGDGHLDDDGLEVLPLDLKVGVGERGVGKAMAEGVHNLGGVVEVTGVALAEHGILIARLVVAVAHVDALEVAHVVVARGLAVRIEVLVVAVVLGGGAGERVGHEGIDGMAGGVDGAGEDARQRLGAVGAGGRHEENRLDGREVGDPVELERARGVDDQDDLVEVVIEVLQDLELGAVGLDVAPRLVLGIIRMVVHGAGHVAALACDTAPHEHGHGALGALEHALGVLELGERAFVDAEVLSLAEVDGAGTHGVDPTCTRGVEIHERRVDRESLGFERAHQQVLVARCAGELRHDGLRGGEVLHVLGEEREGGAGSEGHDGIVVLEQHITLGSDGEVERMLRLADLLGGEVALIVVRVDVLGACGSLPALLVAEHVVGHAADHAHGRDDEVHREHDGGHEQADRQLDDALDHPPHLARGRNLL